MNKAIWLPLEGSGSQGNFCWKTNKWYAMCNVWPILSKIVQTSGNVLRIIFLCQHFRNFLFLFLNNPHWKLLFLAIDSTNPAHVREFNFPAILQSGNRVECRYLGSMGTSGPWELGPMKTSDAYVRDFCLMRKNSKNCTQVTRMATVSDIVDILAGVRTSQTSHIVAVNSVTNKTSKNAPVIYNIITPF